MAWFNALTVCGSERTSKDIVEFPVVKMGAAPRKTPCDYLTSIAWYPAELAHKIYGTYKLATSKDLLATIQATVSSVNPLNYVSWIKQKALRVITSPHVAKVALNHFRNDPEGIYTDLRNHEVFLPILKDLFPKDNPTVDDFLMTCSANQVESYRKPILAFVGPAVIKDKERAFQDILAEHRAFWSKGRAEFNVDASEFAGSFTTAVISKLFLGHPGPFETYQKIHKAICFVTVFSMIRRWSKPTEQQAKEYEGAIATIQEAIGVALKNDGEGSFVHKLRASGLSELRIKTTLMVMFFGGSETTATLLKYVTWRLGQHRRDLQKEVRAGRLETIKFLSESLRLCPPAFIMGRYANQDLQFEVAGAEYRVDAGEGLLPSPFLMGRDPKAFAKPREFDPHRDGLAHLSWLPFGYGPHLCPGQWLARAEATHFIEALVSQYEVESSPTKPELEFKGFMTLGVEKVVLTLRAIAPAPIKVGDQHESDKKE